MWDVVGIVKYLLSVLDRWLDKQDEQTQRDVGEHLNELKNVKKAQETAHEAQLIRERVRRDGFNDPFLRP